MPLRKAEAVWEGNFAEGKGTYTVAGLTGAYTRASRFEEAAGSNPEELLGAAHAACYSMALSAQLSRAEFPPKRVHTTAQVSLEKVEEGFKIKKITLNVEAEVPGIDAALFMEKAETAKKTCPISVALGAIDEIVLNAKLI